MMLATNQHQLLQQQHIGGPAVGGVVGFCADSPAFEPPPPQLHHHQHFLGSGGQHLQQQHTTGSSNMAPPPLLLGNSNNQQPSMPHQFQHQPPLNLIIQKPVQMQQQAPAPLGTNGGHTVQQPGSWYFPLSNGSPQQSEQQSEHLGSSPASPGLMAPQQLLARFGPRHCTESVEVPSSEHVAEIVGRQGCKIKALRAKTNTYIKTPVRGEEPVFVVTGRHEDVAEAKREIECAAEHFTQIRASRRHSQGGCPAPGHVTAYVRVPLRVVGLVVGPKGNTIKRIQQDTHTYIITPSREREPIFEVTGLPQNVEAARREIENHIYQRTGNMPITDPNASIANYDLTQAALQAQQSAIHANNGQRPNYGALAPVSAHRNLLMGAQHAHSPTPYQQHAFQPHQTGAGLLNFHGPQIGFGGSERGASPAGHNQTPASANSLHLMMGALELDGHQQVQKQIPQLSGGGPHLFRSISTNNGRGLPQPPSALARLHNGQHGIGSAFSPWHSSAPVPSQTGGGVDFLDLISTSPSPLLFSASHGCQSSYSSGSVAGIIGGGNAGVIGGGAVVGGLSSVNSSSRDEGLGDSPTNSFGRPHNPDPYQHLSTIWSDLLADQPTNSSGGGDKTEQSTPAKAESAGGGN